MIELVADPVVSPAALVVRVTVVLALGLVVSWLARTRSPSLAHLSGLVSLTLALVAPLIWLGAPAWRLERAVDPVSRQVPAVAGGVQTPAQTYTPSEALPTPPQPSATSSPIGRWSASLFAGLWLTGIGVGLARLTRAVRSARQTREAASAAPPHLRVLAAEAARHLGARELAVDVRISSDVEVPQLSGVWRPNILLPAAAVNWTHQRLDVVLRHELAHAVRRDLPLLLLARLAKIVLWPHPLAWMLERGVRLDCELACDELALRSGLLRSVYGRELVEVAALAGRGSSFAAAMTSKRTSLEVRIRHLARPTRRPARWLAPAFAVLLTLVAGGAFTYGHPGASSDELPWTLLGEDLTANRHHSLPAGRLQIVVFYDGAPSAATAAFELAANGTTRTAWLEVTNLRKFVDRIETREVQVAPGWTPTGRARISGVIPDGVVDGIAYGLTWRDDAGSFHIVRSRNSAGSPSPNSVCSWPIAMNFQTFAARTPQVTDPFGQDAARLAICGAQVVGNGAHDK